MIIAIMVAHLNMKRQVWAFTTTNNVVKQSSSRFHSATKATTNISPANRFKHSSVRHTSTTLYFGVLVPVPDDFFTISGVTLGVAYTLTRSINRVLVENIAWERRLEDTRLIELELQDEALRDGTFGVEDDVEIFTELDLRKRDAALSKSAYGPGSSGDRFQKERRRNRGRTKVMDREDEDFNGDDPTPQETSSKMTEDEIRAFEKEWSVKYDPYYDEPYTRDELPEDSPYVDDKFYGDRRYKNGEIFYRDENNPDLYWRSGGRPRLKQFWEMF